MSTQVVSRHEYLSLVNRLRVPFSSKPHLIISKALRCSQLLIGLLVPKVISELTPNIARQCCGQRRIAETAACDPLTPTYTTPPRDSYQQRSLFEQLEQYQLISFVHCNFLGYLLFSLSVRRRPRARQDACGIIVLPVYVNRTQCR